MRMESNNNCYSCKTVISINKDTRGTRTHKKTSNRHYDFLLSRATSRDAKL